MKRIPSRLLALLLFLCLLGQVKSISVLDQTPKPETAGSLAPAVSSSASPEPRPPEAALAPSPASSQKESRPEPGPEPAQTSPEDWMPVPAYDQEPFFPLDKESLDETARRIGKFLRNIQWGTNIANINTSSEAEFASADELNQLLLLECCLLNEGYTKEIQGMQKEAVEERARFYFGEDAVIDHSAADGDEYFALTWEYSGETESYVPTGWDRMGYSDPFLLSYQQKGDRYEAIFTSSSHSVFLGIYPPNEKEWDLTPEEAESWYREHGAQAKAVLREQEDGRLIMESLEILKGCDPWEDQK